jgi:hypothetical protein
MENEHLESLSVSIDGKVYKLYRDEILADSELRKHFMCLERANDEANDMEYEWIKLRHAIASMKATLQQEAIKYLEKRDKELQHE